MVYSADLWVDQDPKSDRSRVQNERRDETTCSYVLFTQRPEHKLVDDFVCLSRSRSRSLCLCLSVCLSVSLSLSLSLNSTST